MKTSLQQKSTEHNELESYKNNLQTQLGAAAERLQQLNKESESKIQELTKQYSTEASTAREQILTHQSENIDLKDRIQKLSYTFDENIDLKNKIVQLERSLTESKSHYSAELADVQSSLGTHRADLKEKVIENNALKNTVKELTIEDR